MIDAIVTLADRFIDLVERQQVNKRNLYDDFVDPAMTCLEAVHHDYLAGFARYEQLVLDDRLDMAVGHPVFAAIDNDSMYSKHLRSAVFAIGESDVPSKVTPFVDAVVTYLQEMADDSLWEYTLSPDGDPHANIARMVYRNRLLHLCAEESGDDAKRAAAIAELRRIVQGLQSKYAAVQLHHQQMKAQLLRPR